MISGKTRKQRKGFTRKTVRGLNVLSTAGLSYASADDATASH